MNKNLINISKIIDINFVNIYEIITNAANNLKIPFIIVGASARDLLLEYGHGIKTPRITLDIDIAIQVSSWQEFENLKTALLARNKIKETRSIHRLRHEKTGLFIDIIPFGVIEENTHAISWPPNHDVLLNVIGSHEAIQNTQPLRLRNEPPLDILVPSLPCITLLKIITWRDRFPTGTKDALDLAFILRNYLSAGNEDQLSHRHQDLLEDENFDMAQTGARLLGRNIAEITSDNTKKIIEQILENETRSQNRYPLAEDMTREQYIDSFEKNLALINALYLGFSEYYNK